MATRLTQYMARSIRDRVIAHSFDPRYAELEVRKAKLGKRIYNAVYSLKIRKILESMPEGYFPEEPNLKIILGSGQGRHEWADLDKKRPVANKHSRQVAMVFDDNDPLTVDYLKYLDDLATYHKDRHTREQEVHLLIVGFSTVEKLRVGWPEVIPFLGDLTPAEPVQLPAIPISQLNEALGLPVTV